MRIIESATLGPTGQLFGQTVDGRQFLGARFHLGQPVHVSAVGGHVFFTNLEETLFAAIVALTSPIAVPAFPPREIESFALASTLFTPPQPSDDVLTPLSVVLPAGDYALVFGGADSATDFFPFGAKGTGSMPINNVPVAGSSFVFADASYAATWADATKDSGGLRFVVDGDVLNPSAPSAPTNVKVQ